MHKVTKIFWIGWGFGVLSVSILHSSIKEPYQSILYWGLFLVFMCVLFALKEKYV